MKLRSILLIAAGIGIGYALARNSVQDEPYVVKGPRRESTGNPARRLLQGGTQRLTDAAAGRSLEVIRRARGAIRSRLDTAEDDTIWN